MFCFVLVFLIAASFLFPPSLCSPPQHTHHNPIVAIF
jgi:hypothetical protein